MAETLLFTYAAACGFVCAALLATGYQWVTSRPARFEMLVAPGESPLVQQVMQALLVVWAAPYIIMRNAVRGRLIEGRPIGWLFASLGIATLWSGCVGVLLLSLAIQMVQSGL
ncbi:MAG: hypothetical protein KI785_04585 [Devosiaceae bacterium]|nr:hypothetical protein [Devosiaceae bacterium MH13]